MNTNNDWSNEKEQRTRPGKFADVELLYPPPMDENASPCQHTGVFSNQEAPLILSVSYFYLGFHYIGLAHCIFVL